MDEYHLDIIIEKLAGPSKEQIIVYNQWAAVGLDRYHQNSSAQIEFLMDGVSEKVRLSWNSKFPKAAMREDKDIAHHGGLALAWFVMSVLLEYKHLEQTEIGDGVDYRFMKGEPNDDDFNFLEEEHYVEISGILQESKTNTLKGRVKDKHNQITKGGKRNKPSSVIVTLFSQPITVKEIHNEA